MGKVRDLEKEAKVRNRALKLTEDVWEVEADQRHVTPAIETLEI